MTFRAVEHSPPIIVGGFYRSGTSLVRRLLDSHSKIHCPPEIKLFKDFYGDYLHDDLAHIRFFRTLRVLGLEDSELLQIIGKAYVECRERACIRLGKSRWADKNPENVIYLNQWHGLLNGELVFVFVVRHPLDVLSSLNEIGFEKTIPVEFEKRVMLLRDYYFSAMDYVSQHPCQSIIIKYENLVTAPKETLKLLFDDLDEPFEPEVTNLFYHSERVQGIEDPKVSKTREIHNDSIGRWVSDLSDDQIQIATELLGDIFEYYGYGLSADEKPVQGGFFT